MAPGSVFVVRRGNLYSGKGKWRRRAGRGQIVNGKWQVASGKLQMAKGKWQMANGKWQMGEPEIESGLRVQRRRTSN